MTLPTGSLSMSQIATELGLSLPLSLQHSWVRALAQVGGAACDFNSLRGKTGRFGGTLATTTASNFNKVNFSSAPFFGSTLNQLQINNSTLEVFLSFGFSAPNWSGNIRVTNNTTGATVVLSQQDSQDWHANVGPANLIRTGATADSFTLLPSN